MTNENSPWLALRLAIDVGYDLVSEHPEIADYYRQGMSHRQIVETVQNNGGFGREITSEPVLEHAVKYSLIGNPRQEAGKVYGGLMNRIEYEDISTQNRIRSGERSSSLCRDENKGIFNLTEKQKDDAQRKSSESRGQIPWEDYEIKTAFKLKKQGFTARYIAEIINRAHYEGKNIRNKDAVNGMFTRERKSKK